jgi:hypothetical protein
MAQPATKDDTVNSMSIARSQWLRFKQAFDHGHAQFIENADRFDAFYAGEQWAEQDLQRLMDTRRPALTLNMILPTINTVIGEQSTTRVDITFKPRGSGDQETADLLAKVALQVQDQNRFDWVESEVFQDGLITGRGFFDVRIDFNEDIRGEIKIRARDPREVVLDPEAKEYDPSTWKRVYTQQWVTLEDVERLYGKDKADQLRMIGLNGNHYGCDSMVVDTRSNTFGDLTQGYNDAAGVDDEGTERSIRTIRLIECQEKRLAQQRYFVDNRTGDMSVIPEGWDDERVLAFQQRFGLGVVKRWAERIRWTVTADSVTLYDDWSLYDAFTIVPYFPYFRRGRPFGMVENLISAQEQLNKTASQELHIVNTTANSGWTVEDGTLVNMDEHELEERGAETGLVLVHARGTQPPQKIQPNQIPTGLDRIGQKAAINLRSISGVNDGMLGDTSAEVSGVALRQKQARGQIQIQVPLDNLAKTRHFVAERILKLIQQFYTEERIIRIANDMLPGAQGAEQVLVVNQMAEDGSILNDLTIGTYDVVISTQPNRDNFDESQFSEAVQLRELGVMIPDHVIVEYSHLARKQELAELLKQQGGFAEPNEAEVELMQLQQQMQLKAAQLELAKLEGEVMELQARAQLQAAKAESLSAEDRARMSELEAKIIMKREELQTRIQLAMLTAQSRKQDVGSRMLMEHARLSTQRAIAGRQAQDTSPTERGNS